MRSRLALIVACGGYFLVLLDVTVVNVALGDMATRLHADRTTLQWIVDGYALVLAGLLLSAGDLGDLLGRRRMLGVGFALFGGASALCAAAPSPAWLVAGRALQGAGAAALLPSSLAIAGSGHDDEAARARAIGLWAGIGSLGLAAGPIVGGLLVGGFGWRAVFALNVPLTVFALAVLPTVTAPPPPEQRPRLDVRGQLAGGVLLTSTVLALIEGPRLGWGDPVVVTAAGVALAALPAFIAVERRAPRPMLDLRYFRRAAFSAANAGAGLMNLGTLGALFALSLALQHGEGLSPAATGLHLIPLALPLAVLAPFVGRLAARSGPRRYAAAGLALCGVGYLALAVAGVGGAGWLLLLVSGLGLAAGTPAVVTAATAAVEPARAGMAAAVNNAARQTGGAVGVAVLGGAATGLALTGAGVALLAGGALVAVFGEA